MSAATLLIREKNPDNDFVLHGAPPVYTERRSFYPTNSDITTTTKNLSQHEYRAELYKDVLEEENEKKLRGSLRTMNRSLRLTSNDLRKSLQEDSTAKKYLNPRYGGTLTLMKDRDEDYGDDEYADELVYANSYRYANGTRVPPNIKEDRAWLADSEWNTSSGHHVAFTNNIPRATLLNRDPSASLMNTYGKVGGIITQSLDLNKSLKSAEKLRRTVNLDMDLAQVPLTRFTRKDLMASEFFPVTMSYSVSEAGSRPTSAAGSRSRSRTRSLQRLSARQRSRTPERTPISDNFRSMKRLEKLYLITAEAPTVADDSGSSTSECNTDYIDDDPDSAIDVEDHFSTVIQTLQSTVAQLAFAVIRDCTATAPPVILSPYQEEIARLRMERLQLEAEHLKELSRLTALEGSRGPKPKWYELKDTQFHFEAGKNNDMIRTLERLTSRRVKSEDPLSQSQPDLYTLRTRALSFS